MDKPEILRELLGLRGDRAAIDLDDVAEVVAPHHLSTEQLDELLAAVEEAGCPVVAGERPQLKEELVMVVQAARAFKEAHQRRPTIPELAQATQVGETVVWRALRYGRVLGR